MTAELFLSPMATALLCEVEAVQKCVGIINMNMRPMVLKTVTITEIVEKLYLVEQDEG